MLALLPCTESYGLIAQRLQQQGVTTTGFNDWVDYYADATYQAIIDWSWRTVDQLFVQTQSATADYAGIYETSYQHELAFWQAANQLRGLPEASHPTKRSTEFGGESRITDEHFGRVNYDSTCERV